MKSTFPSSFASLNANLRNARLGAVAVTLSLLAFSAAQSQVPPTPPAPPASSAGGGQGNGDNGTMGNASDKPSAAAVTCKPLAVLTRFDTRQQGALHSQQGMAAQWALMQQRVRQQAGACMGLAAGTAPSSAAVKGVNKR
jgi:hypothetical protein